ncbi:uncharacterized protein LOC111872558 isoform X2 [Cryptotermes secundus]|nr:uncharacterized protein LOC111872558 isoform X2 [Cryptotermes secundus]
MMENRIDIEKLISEVHARPAICDMTHGDYMDKTKRKISWEKIVNKFAEQDTAIEEKKTLGEVLHEKRKNVRDRYTREIQARKGKSGCAAGKKTPYTYVEQLCSLQDTVLPRETTSSLHLAVGEVRGNNSGPSSEAETHIETVSSRNQHLGTNRKLHPVEAKILQALESNKESRKRMEKKTEDDNRHFLLSRLASLKALPRALNMKARVDIMQCIRKYEMSHDHSQHQRQQYLTVNAQRNQMQHHSRKTSH